MKIIKQKGILLSKTRFRSSSIIARILTQDGEIISLLFKGALARKRKDSPAAHLIPFAVLEVVYYHKETRGIQTASSVSTVEDFPEIRRDYETQLAAAKFIKTAITPIKEGERYPEIYDLIVAVMRQWNQITSLNQDTVWAGFLLKVLDLAGYKPAIHHCALCQGQLTDYNLKFSPSAGGIICGECPPTDDSVEISSQIRDALQFLMANPMRKYDKLPLTAGEARFLKEIVQKFWNYYLA